MTNYDMDEIERQRERERRSRGIRPENEMKNKTIKLEHGTVDIGVELPERDILKLALLAHEKDVTLNVIINDVLKQGIKDGEYRFEHGERPQLLNETE